MTDWSKVAQDYWAKQPHPLEPSLTIGEFAVAIKMATKAKFGGHASPHEAAAFMKEFKGLNGKLQAAGKEPLTPETFSQALEHMAPVSFALHGRPPSMQEIAQLSDAHPKAVNDYYHHLPDKHYPEIPAGEMVRAIKAAKPWSNEHIQRDPTKNEAAYLYASGQNPQDYYSKLKELDQQRRSKDNAIQAGAGGNPRSGSLQDAGGPQAGQ